MSIYLSLSLSLLSFFFSFSFSVLFYFSGNRIAASINVLAQAHRQLLCTSLAFDCLICVADHLVAFEVAAPALIVPSPSFGTSPVCFFEYVNLLAVVPTVFFAFFSSSDCSGEISITSSLVVLVFFDAQDIREELDADERPLLSLSSGLVSPSESAISLPLTYLLVSFLRLDEDEEADDDLEPRLLLDVVLSGSSASVLLLSFFDSIFASVLFVFLLFDDEDEDEEDLDAMLCVGILWSVVSSSVSDISSSLAIAAVVTVAVAVVTVVAVAVVAVVAVAVVTVVAVVVAFVAAVVVSF